MFNQIKKYLLIFLCTTTISCNKFLDTEPQGYVIPRDIDHFVQLLASITHVKTVPEQIDYISDCFWDPLTAPSKTIGQDVNLETYSWGKLGVGTIPAFGSTFWVMMFSEIYQYNFIVNNVDLAPDGTEQKKMEIKAQARLARAFLYMQDYENAFVAAEEALASENFLVDYNTIVEKDENGIYSLKGAPGTDNKEYI